MHKIFGGDLYIIYHFLGMCDSLVFFTIFCYFSCLSCFTLDLQMSMFSPTYIGFADGASRSTQNLSSTTWVIYSPSDELVSIHGICLGQTTNNIAKYSAIIELLSDAITFGIQCLIVRLDSQLIVLHLNSVYSVRSPTMLRMFLRVRLLERQFDYIKYQHIPRYLNTLTDALANHVLNRHLQHL